MTDFDFRSLDDFIHSRVRLAIMSYLATARSSEFTDLKKKLSLSDGNLSTHLKKLEEAGYVSISKQFKNKKPLTLIDMSPIGDAAFAAYVQKLSAMVGIKS